MAQLVVEEMGFGQGWNYPSHTCTVVKMVQLVAEEMGFGQG